METNKITPMLGVSAQEYFASHIMCGFILTTNHCSKLGNDFAGEPWGRATRASSSLPRLIASNSQDGSRGVALTANLMPNVTDMEAGETG
jgi:hypothetical protein